MGQLGRESKTDVFVNKVYAEGDDNQLDMLKAMQESNGLASIYVRVDGELNGYVAIAIKKEDESLEYEVVVTTDENYNNVNGVFLIDEGYSELVYSDVAEVPNARVIDLAPFYKNDKDEDAKYLFNRTTELDHLDDDTVHLSSWASDDDSGPLITILIVIENDGDRDKHNLVRKDPRARAIQKYAERAAGAIADMRKAKRQLQKKLKK